jgi:hypothetical protein
LEQSPQGRALQRPARIPAVVVPLCERNPALGLLARDIGLACLALRVETVEILFEPFFG